MHSYMFDSYQRQFRRREGRLDNCSKPLNTTRPPPNTQTHTHTACNSSTHLFSDDVPFVHQVCVQCTRVHQLHNDHHWLSDNQTHKPHHERTARTQAERQRNRVVRVIANRAPVILAYSVNIQFFHVHVHHKFYCKFLKSY